MECCVSATQWNQLVRLRREAHARYALSKTTAAWEEYATSRKKLREIVKKGIWKDVVNKTNGDFDGGMIQMWVGIKGMLGKQAGEARHGNSYEYIKNTKR